MILPDSVEILGLAGVDRSRKVAPAGRLGIAARSPPVNDSGQGQAGQAHADHQTVAVNVDEYGHFFGKFAEFIRLQFVTMFTFHNWSAAGVISENRK